MATKKKATKKASPIQLASVEKAVAAIDAHVASVQVSKAPKGAQMMASASAGEFICTNFTKVKPVLDLLGMILGKTVGAVILTISNGLSAYCSIDSSIATTADLKVKSKAVAQICKAYVKFKPVLDLSIMLFATKPEWLKALNGLRAAIESICADAPVA